MVDKKDKTQEENLQDSLVVNDNKDVEDTSSQDTDDLGFDDIAKAAEQVVDQVNSTTKILSTDADSPTLDYILDVTLQVSVEVGRARMSIQDLLQLGQGAVVELEKLAGEPLDIYMNGKQVAKGEAVIVNEKFGVRVLDVISREERMLGMK